MVRIGKLSYGEVAGKTGVPKSTIFRRVNKSANFRKTVLDQNGELEFCRLLNRNPTKEHTPLKMILQQAYAFAMRLKEKSNSKLPQSWLRQKAAGIDWWRGFTKRMEIKERYIKDAKCAGCRTRIKNAAKEFVQCHCCHMFYCESCFVLFDCQKCYLIVG